MKIERRIVTEVRQAQTTEGKPVIDVVMGGLGIILSQSASGRVLPGDELKINYSTKRRLRALAPILKVSNGTDVLKYTPAADLYKMFKP